MKKLIVVLSLATAMFAFSATASAAQWGSAATVTKIDIEDSGAGNPAATYVTFNPAPISNTGCSAGSTSWWKISPASNDAATKILNVVISAKLAGRQVIPYFTGCDPSTGWPMFTAVQVL